MAYRWPGSTDNGISLDGSGDAPSTDFIPDTPIKTKLTKQELPTSPTIPSKSLIKSKLKTTTGTLNRCAIKKVEPASPEQDFDYLLEQEDIISTVPIKLATFIHCPNYFHLNKPYVLYIHLVRCRMLPRNEGWITEREQCIGRYEIYSLQGKMALIS